MGKQAATPRSHEEIIRNYPITGLGADWMSMPVHMLILRTFILCLALSISGCRTGTDPSRQPSSLHLAAGEQLLDEIPANLERGIETVGGTMTITTHRILFQPHSVNFQKNSESILLNEVTEVRPVSIRRLLGVFNNGIVIELSSGRRYRFVVHDRDKVLELLKARLERIKEAPLHEADLWPREIRT